MAAGENFTAQERARLAPFVSDLDAPVFALMGLPETTRGAAFARYSRYPGTLRRLLLDEFGEELDRAHPDAGRSRAGARAEALYERVLGEYGDDSVAQLGGAHIACEWVSNVLTKVLQRPRLGAYLEQSTRYIPYDRPMPGGGYRYHRDPDLGPAYEQAMESLFATYATLLPRLESWLAERFAPEPGAAGAAHERAVRAKALDLLRGLLPAAALSHVGIFASGQTFERLIMHLRAHPLPEARRCGEGILAAMRAVAPSFVTRVDRAERGGEWVEYLIERTAAQERAARRLGLDNAAEEEPGARLLQAEGDEQTLLAALVFEQSSSNEAEARERIARLDGSERSELLGALLGGRANRRHLPGRGLEALRYRFEIVSDYGAFRDLQRHRMLTVQWQALSPHLGAEVPEEIEGAGLGDEFRGGLERSREAWQQLVEEGLEQHAPYALCLAYRVRYVLDLNAREAMHLIELRSGREGHSSYRAIAHQMHEQIAAVHPAVAAAMTHLDDSEEPRLERLAAESRRERRAAG
jgi:thymidylate synthase ThyX